MNTKSELEATELYKEGGKEKGPLSRHHSESMLIDVFRRNRWRTRLRTLDPKYNMSENISTDMLLGGGKLDRNEKLMILASVNNT